VGRSRFDFLLRGRGNRRLALEVKSVTLVEEEVGLFPDAVTARGARHLRELADLAGRAGWAAAVLFAVQRADVRRVRAAREIDPNFAAALEEARRAGVRVLARRCRVGLDRITLGAPVPVLRS
jgi:sugar fermentation stimulation protein A